MTQFRQKYQVESARLQSWDYTKDGWYFVTVCTQGLECFFGDVVNGKMHLSAIGEIAHQYWVDIPHHFLNAKLDVFVIMPSHLHGIVIVENHGKSNADSNCRDVACNVSTMSKISPKPGSLGAIVRSYKSAVTRWCRLNSYLSFVWQPRFYDHIIRNEKSLNDIREYIINNPMKWELDKNNPENLYM